jgi:hypothetical protein
LAGCPASGDANKAVDGLKMKPWLPMLRALNLKSCTKFAQINTYA